MELKHKSFKGLKITNEEAGEVEAIFATLGVKDHDGDVTLKGAFDNGAPVQISAYNHASWKDALPVGKGTIEEAGDNVVFKGQFFMDTQAGRETFAVVKGLEELGEWSYGYDTVDQERGTKDGEPVNIIKKQKVYEVSPVILGAGLTTRTTMAKALKPDYKGLTFSEHFEAVLADLKELTERTAEVVTKRAEKGKELGEESKESFAEVKAQVDSLSEQLTKSNNDDNSDVDTSTELDAEWLRFVAQEHTN